MIDLAVAIADVIDEVTDKNIVESLAGIVEFCIVHWLDGSCKEVDGNAADVL